MFDSIDLIDHLLFKDNRLVIINNAKRRFSCAQVDSAVKRHRSGLLCFKDISRGRLYAREAASIEYQRVARERSLAALDSCRLGVRRRRTGNLRGIENRDWLNVLKRSAQIYAVAGRPNRRRLAPKRKETSECQRL